VVFASSLAQRFEHLEVLRLKLIPSKHKGHKKIEVQHLGLWVCLEGSLVDASADVSGFPLAAGGLLNHISLPLPNKIT
jgi:hypothetical protein